MPLLRSWPRWLQARQGKAIPIPNTWPKPNTRVLFTAQAGARTAPSLSCSTAGLLLLPNPSAAKHPPRMAATQQIRNHGGHSPARGHAEKTYIASQNKSDAGVRITRLGLYVNLGMAISKGIGGYFFNSQALVADAFHALTDLVSDFMTLATISVALKPPTEDYPNGFGKVESFGSLVVSGLLFAGGIAMFHHSGFSLYHEFFAQAAQAAHDGHDHGLLGHSHSARDLIPNINAAWLAAGSIVIKEYLYRASERC
jgi:hypothetical protein